MTSGVTDTPKSGTAASARRDRMAHARRHQVLHSVEVDGRRGLDVLPRLICARSAALSFVAAAEIRKAVLRRRTAATAVQSAGARPTGATTL